MVAETLLPDELGSRSGELHGDGGVFLLGVVALLASLACGGLLFLAVGRNGNSTSLVNTHRAAGRDGSASPQRAPSALGRRKAGVPGTPGR